VKPTAEHLRRRTQVESIRSIARRAGVAPSTMSHAFKTHDAALAEKAAARVAAEEGRRIRKEEAEKKRKADQRAKLAETQRKQDRALGRIDASRFRRLNGYASDEAAYLAWLWTPKTRPARLIGKDPKPS
jgi:hypothetical protein